MSDLQVAVLRRAMSTIRVKRGHEVPFSEIPDGPVLAHSRVSCCYQGALSGEGLLEELKCYLDPHTALVYGVERVTGSIGGQSGSFVLEHNGRLENGVLKSRRLVVPGSGTGDFARLRGEIDFASGGGLEFPILFEYRYA